MPGMTGTLMQDLNYALRAFVRAPRFTVPAVVALALGIGATAAIFSVVRGVMLRPLPYKDPNRIVSVWETSPSRNMTRGIVANANYIAARERNQSFEYFGMVASSRGNLLLNGQPLDIHGMVASSEALAALGVQPVMGRTFTPEEDLRGSDAVILLGFEFWQSRLAGRHDVLGSTVSLNGVTRNVVGIMPPGIHDRRGASGLLHHLWLDDRWTARRVRPWYVAWNRQAAPGRIDRASLERVDRHLRAARTGESAPQRRTIGDAGPNSRVHDRNDQARTPGPVGRRCARAADRLRQRCEPAAGARHHSSARDSPPHRPWRRAADA